MIGRLQGQLLAKQPPQILVDVHGVGYEVSVPMSTFCNLPELGHPVTLVTHFVVREDAQILYGFFEERERAAFRALIKVSGVGPRIALAVLSGLSTEDLALAVEGNDAARLTRVPGIGKKTAERLVLELKGKLDTSGAGLIAVTDERADIISALVALGYAEREAQKAVKELGADVSVSDGIRQALQLLSH